MNNQNIFERDKSGEQIWFHDPEHCKLKEVINKAQEITFDMNQVKHTPEEIKKLFEKLTNSEVDDEFRLIPPFYTDFGKNIKVGKNVFINSNCTFMDRGGITIGDDALIGPKVNLVTINHPLHPKERQSTISTPIVIEKNVWIGIGATIMPGVIIGENAVIGAGSIVTKNVPKNALVAGIPARVIRIIEENNK